MPAKPLDDEQLADARRLKTAFRQWQDDRRAQGLPWAQDAIAEDLFGFGQSALAQYLNGTIPLNPAALKKFCTVLKLPPAAISPSITQREIARAFDWIGVEPPEMLPLTERPKRRITDTIAPGIVRLPAEASPQGGLRKTAQQKRRGTKKHKKE